MLPWIVRLREVPPMSRKSANAAALVSIIAAALALVGCQEEAAAPAEQPAPSAWSERSAPRLLRGVWQAAQWPSPSTR